MCGIYGKVAFDGDVDVLEGSRRTELLTHRGPDYCGSWFQKNLFLGHTRLSILDLTSAGNQPFGDDHAKLIFNGEIYNWKQLHSKYLNGQELHSHSDTEVLFRLLNKMGSECLSLLNGMFALAYYDSKTQKLLLARDMVGIKPAYFIPGLDSFEFSSEIKNLDYLPDADRLKEYLLFGRIGEDFFPYSNVKEILPGSFIELDCVTGKWFQKPYCEVESLVNPEAYEGLAKFTGLEDRLDSLLQQSVAMHEQSDAPIGFLCSGGLDSSLITAIAAKRNANISLYHADFEGEGGELSYAEEVAHHIGAPLHTTKISKGEFWTMFSEMTYAHDSPVQHRHSLSLGLIARRVKVDGLKVLLSGEGADELFAGYWFHPAYSRLMHGRSSGQGLRRRIGSFLRKAWSQFESDPDPYWFFREFSPAFQKHAHVGFGDAWSLSEPIQALSLVGQDFKAWRRWQQAVEAFAWMDDKREAFFQSFQLFYLRYHLQPLLHRMDRMLMLHSIEGRVPFLENELFQFALNLPLARKIRGIRTKHILKEVALRYLPPNIVNRRKMGFTVPSYSQFKQFPKILENGFVADWTRLTKKEMVAWCNGDGNLFYRLISIEVWGQIFVNKIPWMDVKIED